MWFPPPRPQVRKNWTSALEHQLGPGNFGLMWCNTHAPCKAVKHQLELRLKIHLDCQPSTDCHPIIKLTWIVLGSVQSSSGRRATALPSVLFSRVRRDFFLSVCVSVMCDAEQPPPPQAVMIPGSGPECIMHFDWMKGFDGAWKTV